VTINGVWIGYYSLIHITRDYISQTTILLKLVSSVKVPLISGENQLATTSCDSSQDWLNQFKVKVILQSGTHLEPMARLLLLSDSCGCWCGMPLLTRGRVSSLQLLLGIASAVTLGSESHGTHDHILLSQISNWPNLEGQVPVFTSPRNRLAQLNLQALRLALTDRTEDTIPLLKYCSCCEELQSLHPILTPICWMYIYRLQIKWGFQKKKVLNCYLVTTVL
jgi:hypothetical protein